MVFCPFTSCRIRAEFRSEPRAALGLGQPAGTAVGALAERDLRLRWVLRTHHHDDGLQSSEFPSVCRLDAPVIQGDPRPGTHTVADGERRPFGNEFLQVLATPGHTSGCLSFVWRDRVFCGGLLAVDACPHQPRPANPAALGDSVTQRIFTLPALLPGLLLALVLLYALNFVLSTLIGKFFFQRGDAIALVYGTVMRNLSIALAIAMGVFGARGADAALLIALAYIVQVQAAAWCVKLTDRLFGPPPAAPGTVAAPAKAG